MRAYVEVLRPRGDHVAVEVTWKSAGENQGRAQSRCICTRTNHRRTCILMVLSVKRNDRVVLRVTKLLFVLLPNTEVLPIAGEAQTVVARMQQHMAAPRNSVFMLRCGRHRIGLYPQQ